MQAFEPFGLSPAVIKAITELGFEQPTPVQSQVIPALLGGGRDLVALAQTGTGKTAAFGLPIVQLTNVADAVAQSVVLCPTRELCVQVAKDMQAFARYTPGFRVVAVYGGAPIPPQIRGVDGGAQVVVATPGRLNDILRRRPRALSQVRRVVLDEADEMLNMGFQEDLETILKAMPEKVQTLLFSATMPPEVAKISAQYMTHPEEIQIGQRNAGAENISHEYYVVHSRERYAALKRIIDAHPDIYGIIFCRTRMETNEVASQLMADGYNADTLHGDLNQSQRDRVMKNFRDRRIQLLIATDVAARGLDVTDLTHVINYNLPDVSQHYTHRSGRTGRAGKEGVSISIVGMREEYKIRHLERLLKRPFVRKAVPSGRDVCEMRLRGLMERLVKVNPDDRRADLYLPGLYEVLSGLSREELVRRFVLVSADRILSDYEKAVDLNVGARGGEGRSYGGPGREDTPSGGGDGIARMQINLGSRNGFTPAMLITMINRATRGPMIRIGRIHVTEQATVFQIPSPAAASLESSLNGTDFNGRTVQLRSLGAAHHEKRPMHPHGGYEHSQRRPYRPGPRGGWKGRRD